LSLRFQRVAAPVGSFRLVADNVSQRSLGNLARRRALAGSIAEELRKPCTVAFSTFFRRST
jgi:hypothetical protein